jgi:hypothetical protein
MRIIRHKESGDIFRSVIEAMNKHEKPVYDRSTYEIMEMSDPFPVRCCQTLKTYSGINEASKALGISAAKLRNIIRDEKHIGGRTYEYADRPRTEAASYRIVRGSRIRQTIVCRETGQEFNSTTEAAAALGLNPDAIARVIAGNMSHHKGFTFFADEPIFAEYERAEPDDRVRQYVVEVYSGLHFDTVVEAAAHFKTTRQSIYRCINESVALRGKHRFRYDDCVQRRKVRCNETGKLFQDASTAATFAECSHRQMEAHLLARDGYVGVYSFVYDDEPHPFLTWTHNHSGVTYDSIGAASRAEDLTGEHVATQRGGVNGFAIHDRRDANDLFGGFG